MTLSYIEEKMLSEMVWMAIRNGNHEHAKAFVPTPEQYKMCCDLANRLDAHIKQMQENYGLE